MVNYFQRLTDAWSLLRRAYSAYAKEFLVITILGFLGGIAGGIGITSIIPLFSLLIDQDVPGIGFIMDAIRWFFETTGLPYTLTFLLSTTITLFVLKAIFQVVAQYINARMAANYEETTRRQLLSDTLRSSWSHMMTQKSGFLERVILDDVAQATNIILYLSGTILILGSLIMYVVVAINISNIITLLTLFIGGISFLALRPLFYRSRKFGRLLTATTKETAHTVNEAISGAKTIRTLNAESGVEAKTNKYFRELSEIRVRLAAYNGITSGLTEPLGLVFVSILFVINYTSPNFNIASFAAIVYLIQKIFSFINTAQVRVRSIAEIIPYLQEVLKYQDIARSTHETHKGSESFAFKSELEFSNVSFAYTPNREVLHGVTFSIAPGKIVGLIGPSGAGKTTIVDLILQLLSPNKGSIKIDGVDIDNIRIEDWRHHIGYVPQDPFLINGSIKQNIEFFDSKISSSDIQYALKAANIDAFVENLPNKLDAQVGERGVQLSGGQRQRIVLARVLARRPDILILDEATSALDPESEQVIQQTLAQLKGSVTILVIAHRLSTIKQCDQLIAIDNGHIIDTGAPDDLLAKKDSYFHKVHILNQT